MGKIKVLDEQLANQIAAGEVVERPASVVKELVENAVDAGSTTVDISIEEGGLSMIRVIDNGYGIEASDIVTAFYRHATSKISTSSDLFRIASLGFRGEALPSIAAVSRLQCISSETSTGLARKIVIEGGKITVDEPANAPQGTEMIVQDLFYNTPARLKYMKAIQTELGHISDFINRIALAHPGIAFTFKHNGNVLLRTLGTGDRLQVIAAVYGSNTAKVMLPIEAETSDYELRGYISKPELTRANRNGITAIVNGRFIRSHTINQSLLQAYHTLLPINRFPLAILELGMHPSLLDVNVHPSKMEVRFSKEPELRAMIEKAVKDVLGRQRHIPGPESSTKAERSKPLFVQDAISFHRPEPMEESFKPFQAQPQANKPQGTSYKQPAIDREYVPRNAAEKLYAPPSPSSESQALREASAPWEQAASALADTVNTVHDRMKEQLQSQRDAAPQADKGDIVNSELPSADNQLGDAAIASSSSVEPPIAMLPSDGDAPDDQPSFPELYWIGQHHGTYIVAQSEEGLYLIDQHAAHERINYEYYYQKFGNPQAASQQLLVPLTLEFTAGEASQLRELLPLFAQAGVEVEPFGAQTFLVRAYPEWMPQGEEQALLEEMAELLITERKSINIGKLREKAAIMCSCKASIKANDRMNREEGETLLARLANCKQPYTCPHGRPIIVHLSTYQLEKMFKRVMS
ncbi:DNA mismatch repair protein MutL [Paenibacillus sp. FSL H8-0548]|uniref:DNA mismatch repair endonuclease MutL n=1 Tax=Paenibacillus sp. FSL H8-0548 TaxID=1920422 RepID=UPI00096E8376|nr:DNA mismatch repair endonuclease MutL [Paenibacillus sp. FSL H8-0548]OMF38247.1 DNA mismatch repair protein MutL [Paenibacillus sp. FSL H8-0548]